MTTATTDFIQPDRLVTRSEVLTHPCPVPVQPGVYGWWFPVPLADIDTDACIVRHGATLLYTGISPKKPPDSGGQASQQTLRNRIRTHYSGNAEGSTLGLTLGCLLSTQLGIELRRIGSGR